MPVNRKVDPIIDIDKAKRFHRDEKTKKLIKRYDHHREDIKTCEGKSFSEILNEEWQRQNKK